MIERQRTHHVGGAAKRHCVSMTELLAVGVRSRLAPPVAVCVNRSRTGDVGLGQTKCRCVIPAALDGGHETCPVASGGVAEHTGSGQHLGVRRCQARFLETPFGLCGMLGNVVFTVRRTRCQADRLVQQSHSVRERVPEQRGSLDDHVDSRTTEILGGDEFDILDHVSVIPHRTYAEQMHHMCQIGAVLADQFRIPEREAYLARPPSEPGAFGLELLFR